METWESKPSFDELKKSIDGSRGDERDRAINDLIGKFQDYVHQLASRRLGPADRSKFDSVDIQQEVLIKMAADIRDNKVQVNSEGEFVKLLGETTVNKFIDFARFYRRLRRSVRREVPLGRPGDSETAASPAPACKGPGPATDFFGRESLSDLWEILESSLQPDEFYMFEQRYKEGVSYEVIGERMGKSGGAVRTQLGRVRDRLKAVFAGFSEYRPRVQKA